MKKYIVCFNVYPFFSKTRRRTIIANSRQQAIEICKETVAGSFYHYIKSEK